MQTSLSIRPICAFDVRKDGVSIPLDAPWPSSSTSTDVNYRWLHFDLAEPTLDAWTKEFLPSLASTALRQTETRPRFDVHSNGIILNLRGVNLNEGSTPEDMVSIRLWISEGLIVSTRARKVWAVDAIRQQMELGEAPLTIGRFVSDLSLGLTKRIDTVSVTLEEQVDELEECALERIDGLSDEVAKCRQRAIKLRRFIRPQKDALVEMFESNNPYFDQNVVALIAETANRATRTLEALDATHERLAAIQDHLDIQHSTALGRNSYVLSVVAAIFLPLGFLTGLFGINVGGMPGVELEYGFWIVSGASAFLGIVLFFLFRHLKWL